MGHGTRGPITASAFERRSATSPELVHFLPIIDRVAELGSSEVLYPSTSLDNLVISARPNPYDRRGRILVTPKGNGVELRLYKRDGTTEVSQVGAEQVRSEIERLLPKLIQDQKQG